MGMVIVEREAPSQIVSVSKTFEFNEDNKKTSKIYLLNVSYSVSLFFIGCCSHVLYTVQEMNNEGTTEVQLKQQIISCKEQLDDKRERKTTDAKQNEPFAKTVNPEILPTESGDPPAESDPPTEPPTESDDPESCDPPTYLKSPPTETLHADLLTEQDTTSDPTHLDILAKQNGSSATTDDRDTSVIVDCPDSSGDPATSSTKDEPLVASLIESKQSKELDSPTPDTDCLNKQEDSDTSKCLWYTHFIRLLTAIVSSIIVVRFRFLVSLWECDPPTEPESPPTQSGDPPTEPESPPTQSGDPPTDPESLLTEALHADLLKEQDTTSDPTHLDILAKQNGSSATTDDRDTSVIVDCPDSSGDPATSSTKDEPLVASLIESKQSKELDSPTPDTDCLNKQEESDTSKVYGIPILFGYCTAIVSCIITVRFRFL